MAPRRTGLLPLRRNPGALMYIGGGVVLLIIVIVVVILLLRR